MKNVLLRTCKRSLNVIDLIYLWELNIYEALLHHCHTVMTALGNMLVNQS